ncbi:MAG TPA: Fic family protein [Arthrobacter sp.]
MNDQPRRISGDFAYATPSGEPPAWPGVSYEEYLSGADQYAAAMVPQIAGLDPQLDSRTQALVEQATMDLVRLDAELGEKPQLASLLLQGEAAASSRIENVSAGAQEISTARLVGRWDIPDTPAGEVVDSLLALQRALELSGDLSLKSIAVINFGLLERTNHDNAGVYRRTQNWIGGRSPQTARYVPPHGDRVITDVDDVVDFMARDDIPVLTQAALAHAQFEAIHPFADGNGRTGRALVAAMLKDKGITRHVGIPISAGLLATGTRAYISALTEYRDGNIQPIVELFAISTFHAVHSARRLGRDVRDAEDFFRGAIGDMPPSVRRVLEMLPDRPVLTAEMVAARSGLSAATAYRAVERLEAAGILVPAGKLNGTRLWAAEAIINALDDFAGRAAVAAE